MTEPLRMQLDTFRVGRYRQFFMESSAPSNEQVDQTFVLEFTDTLAVLVGPNNSGKSSLLKALELFFKVVKQGSGTYELKQAKQLLGIDEDLSEVILQGTYTIHYRNSLKTKKLVLNVVLMKANPVCEKTESYGQSGQQHRKEEIAVSVIGQELSLHDIGNVNMRQLCPSCYRRLSLLLTDYGIFRDLFPQVVSFNSKNVFNGSLNDLFRQNPNIRNCRPEINEEISKIFPSFRLDYKEEILSKQDPSYALFLKQNIDLEKMGSPLLTIGMTPSISNEMIHQRLNTTTLCSEGVLKCLSMIITICCADPNSIVIIDEPDAHVFPNAQRLLIDFFYRKMRCLRNSNLFCQMIITTHSTDIMQAVKLEHIQQIYVNPTNDRPIGIRSLAGTRHLFDAMTSLGTSFLSHGEFVRLGVHRKVLLLENRSDYNFLYGLIHRGRPALLNYSFTVMDKSGRTTPSQTEHFIRLFRQFLPDKATLHLFILVDADLRMKSKLKEEENIYNSFKNSSSLNVQLEYHCWDARDWENWLLSDENLLFEMLCDKSMYDKDPVIKQLRDQIQQHRSADSIFAAYDPSQHRQSVNDRELFEEWLDEELQRHFQKLLIDLNKGQMQGIEPIDAIEEKRLQDEACKQFLKENHIGDDIMDRFGSFRAKIKTIIGEKLRKESEDYKQREEENKRQQKANSMLENRAKQNQQSAAATKADEDTKTTNQTNMNAKEKEKQMRQDWLDERQLPQTPEGVNKTVRKAVTKWIDAKSFFQHLTSGKDSGRGKGLDDCWRQVFAMGESEDNLFKRYFHSLDAKDPDKWPKDFDCLLEKFERFVKGS